jgi:hypothetical protein
MPRCMAGDDRLLGVMGLDPPCINRHAEGCRGGVCCGLRRLRHVCARHVPGAVTLARRGDLLLHRFTPEGVGIGVLHRALKKLPPPTQMASAIQRGNSPQKLEAWRACRRVWAVKAARFVADHGLRYHSHNPHQVLALRAAMLGVLGPVTSPQQAHRRVRAGLLAIDPTFDRQRGLQDLDEEAIEGRRRLHDTLLVLHEVLQHERYRRVLFHPEMDGWGHFEGVGQVAFVGLLAGAGVVALLCSKLVLGIVLSSCLAFATNELRMLIRDLYHDESPASSGLRGWLFSTRYTGRCAF